MTTRSRAMRYVRSAARKGMVSSQTSLLRYAPQYNHVVTEHRATSIVLDSIVLHALQSNDGRCHCRQVLPLLSEFHAYQAFRDYIGARHDPSYGKKKPWVWAVMETVNRRFLENNLDRVLYRKAPNPKSDTDVPSGPQLPKKPKGSVSLQLKQKDVEVSDPDDDPRLVLFPKEEPEEIDHAVGLPKAANEDDKEAEEESPEAAQLVQEKMERWNEQVKCVELLNKMKWLTRLDDTAENYNALRIIFENGMAYCRDFTNDVILPWNLSQWPLNPRVWLAEMERTLYQMRKRKKLPRWLEHPSDRNIRNDASDAADGFTDPGNLVLDVLVHALRLWHYCDASKASMVIRQSPHEYGHRGNRSSVGPVNLRGNIVEAMSRDLQRNASWVPRSWKKEYDPYKYWWTKDVAEWERWGEPEEPPRKKTRWNQYDWY